MVGNGEIYFDGMTYKKDGADKLTVYLAIEGKDGAPREVTFDYRRKVL